MSEMSSATQNVYCESVDDLVRKFNTDSEKGLKLSEIEQRHLEYGYNELPKVKKSIWKLYLAPLFNFLIVILIITGIIIVILALLAQNEEYISSTVITWTVVGLNSSTAIIQQFRAQKALKSLREISALRAKVIRDGKQVEIDTKDIVPGDILVLNQGAKVPADARLIEQMNLTTDEAALTGESEPVEKACDAIEKEGTPIQKQNNMVFMGTYIHTGRGKAIVSGTGVDTEIGKISQTLNEMGSIEDIPLTRKLNRLGYILGTIVCINLTILIIYKFTFLQSTDSFTQDNMISALVDSIIRAMNIVPINLPLLSTLVLITGVLNMAQSGVIIKNLSSIESLGRVSVICSDKTGTITKNEMTVEKFWVNDEEYVVTGSGYDNMGEIIKDDYVVDLSDNPTFHKFIISMVVNNNAKLVIEEVKIRVAGAKEKAIRKALGSPTEAALLVLAEKAGIDLNDLINKFEIIKEYSFSSEVKRMTTVCNLFEDKKDILAFSKGAPERVLNITTRIEKNGDISSLDDVKKQEILNEIQKRANQGYRTLAIAYKKLNSFEDQKRDEIEKDLIFLGFVSIMDPPRYGVEKAVRDCQSADIKVIMITGDHPATAKTIATNMGIFREGNLVATGDQINDLSNEDFEKTTVFARVEPSDKEIIVKRYQSKGRVVAMTGDGINDSPALKLANAGVAMGITGTDLAKETSDMVITDDNFASIEQGVEIGRGLFSKIRAIIYFFILTNIMEASIFFTYEFIPNFILFGTFTGDVNNWQHIYIFGIVHSLPSIALVMDTLPKDIMHEPPRDEEQILNKNMWIMLLVQAFLMGLGIVLAIQLTLGGFIPVNEWNNNEIMKLSYIPKGTTDEQILHMKARTMFITTIYILECNFIWTFRRPNKSVAKSLREEPCYILLIILIFTFLIHLSVIMFSYQVNYAINDTLGLNLQLNYLFLSATDWLICIVLALPGLLGIEIFKYYARKKDVIF